MEDNKLLSTLKKVLLKKAKGYMYKEEVDEYESAQEKPKKESVGVSQQLDFSSLNINFKPVSTPKKSLTLVKKKVSSHHVPPDLAAIKLLMDYFITQNDDELCNLSDKELNELKESLIDQLKKL